MSIKTYIKQLASPAVDPWAQIGKFSLLGLLGVAVMAGLFALGLGYANIAIGFIVLWATAFFLLQPYNVTSVAVVGLIGAVFSSAPGAFNKARQSIRTVTWGYIQAVCWILMLIAVLSAVFSIRMEGAVDPATVSATTSSESWSVAEFIAGVFRLLLLGVAAVAMSIAFELPAGAWKTRIVVFILLLIGAVTVWTMGLNTLTSVAVDKGSSMLPAAKATSTASTTKPSAKVNPSAENLVFTIPSESGVMTLKPGVRTSLILPEGTLGYRAEVIGASDAEKQSDSWKQFVAYRATSPNNPNQDDWVGDPAAFKVAGKSEIQIMIFPTNEHTRLIDALTS